MVLFLHTQVRDAATGELLEALRGQTVTVCLQGTNTPLEITEAPSGVPVPGAVLKVTEQFAVPSFNTPDDIFTVDVVAANGARATLQSFEGGILAAQQARAAAQAALAAAVAAQQAAENAALAAGPLPPGGTTHQALVKASDVDRDVVWGDVSSGPSGEGTVTAVGGKAPDESGNVPLTAGDIGAAATAHSHPADQITAEDGAQLPVAAIPDIPAGKVSAGTFDAARIPNLSAGKIEAGVFHADRIPTNLAAYVRSTQATAAEGDLLGVGPGKAVVPVTVEAADAGDIDYDGSTTVADRIAELLTDVAALKTTGPSVTNTALPVISGTFEVGETVSTTTGSWDPTADSYTYEWQRDGSAISGATSDDYVLTSADLGTNKVRVKVTAIKAGHTSGVAFSTPISVTADLMYVGLADVFESANTSSDVTLVRDGTVQEGDYLVAILGSGHNAATADFSAQSGSGTWARLGPPWPGTGSATNRVCGIFGHVVGSLGTEPDEYVFAHTPGTATAKAGQLLVFRYVNPAAPVNVAVTDYLGTSISNGRRTADLAVTKAGAIMLFVGWKEGSSASNVTVNAPPAGMTHVDQTIGGELGVSSITVIESYVQDVDAGATGTRDIVWSAATNPRAQAIVLQGV